MCAVALHASPSHRTALCQVYRWTRANTYFQLGARDGIGVGGGTHFALWLDPDWERGTSAFCETFNSPTLASSEAFRVRTVELWHLVP